MSGIQATIGGGLGNHALGNGRGDVSDDLLGMEVVLPDGRILQTGGRAFGAGDPVTRGYGPDLTGLFTHDAGAFGIKTQATFRLQRRPAGVAFACYGFRDRAALVDAMIATERLGLTASNMAFSHYHHTVFAGQRPTREDKAAILTAMKATYPNPVRRMRHLLTLAVSRNMAFLLKWPFSTFTIIDAMDQHTADRAGREVGRVMASFGGRALNPSLGIVMRAQPFMPISKLIVGRDGECSFPSNFSVPLSKGQAAMAFLEAFFAEHERDMARHGVFWTRLVLTYKGLFGVEPIIYWRDRMNPLRFSVLSDEQKAAWAERPDRAEARAFVIALRQEMVARMEQFQPVHFQIGKYYDYRAAVQSDAHTTLLDAFKAHIDPAGLMNPGALGLP